MRYTVVIPAYNSEAFVADVLRSVLAQTVPPERVIVVDDGSTDATAAVIASIGGVVELVRQANAGAGAATTRGLAMVTTPIVATNDADDLWLPDKMARQLALLESDSTIAGVFGRMVNFKGDPANAHHDKPYDGWSRTSMVIRTEVALRTGAIHDPAGAGDMVDWIARVREGGNRLVMLPEVVALRRVHAGSMTYAGRQNVAEGYLSVARAAMERRRARKAEDKS